MYKVYLTEEEVKSLLNICSFKEIHFIRKISNLEDKLYKIHSSEDYDVHESHRLQQDLIYFYGQRCLVSDIIQKLLSKEEC